MLNLFVDIIVSSLTGCSSPFIVYDFTNHHHFIYIIVVSLITAIYTLNALNFIIVLFLYYFNQYLKKYLHNAFILNVISYLVMFNINMNVVSLIYFIISVLIIYFNPYN
jgi:hypothetical protein